MTTTQVAQLPPQVEKSLQELTQQLSQICQENLISLVLYGGLVRGTYSEARSDINLMLVLGKADGAALQALAAPLTAARRKSNVEPILLEHSEIARMADVFPTKILDIQRSHRVLTGRDVFGEISVTPEHIRLSLEQGLRNTQLRLRRMLAVQAEDGLILQRFLCHATRPLALELRQLLELKGQSCAAESTRDIFAAVGPALGLDEQVLTRLSQLRDEEFAGDARSLAVQLLEVLGKAVQHADALEGQV